VLLVEAEAVASSLVLVVVRGAAVEWRCSTPNLQEESGFPVRETMEARGLALEQTQTFKLAAGVAARERLAETLQLVLPATGAQVLPIHIAALL
jgi:hypothetical protein